MMVDRHAWMTETSSRRAPRRAESANRLVLLGTGGGSNPKATRCGYSNAIVVGDAVYLLDCGEGAHRQMWRAGFTANPRFGHGTRPLVRSVCLTHLHADHLMDLANVFQGSWPGTPIDIFGPVRPVRRTPRGTIRFTHFGFLSRRLRASVRCSITSIGPSPPTSTRGSWLRAAPISSTSSVSTSSASAAISTPRIPPTSPSPTGTVNPVLAAFVPGVLEARIAACRP